MDITITRNPNPKAKPADESKLGFGGVFTDHMLLMDYDEGQGWHDLRIVPYGDFACPRPRWSFIMPRRFSRE